MDNLDPKIVAALISAIVSVIGLLMSFLFRSFFDKHFHVFKLDFEYKYEQRKKIKDILSKNKIHLINSADALNHRLFNFSVNHSEKWHCVKNINRLENENYFISFVYRLICFFSWIRKLEKEMVFLDTTIASDRDLELIKFHKLFQQIMCDVQLFEGFEYDRYYAKDHFFNNNFQEMVETFHTEDSVLCFSGFKERLMSIHEQIKPIMNFINCISPDENRYRWDKLQILHIALIAYLNTFGYDYQYTPKSKLKKAIRQNRKTRLLINFKLLINEYRLNKQKKLKQILKIYNNV